jgi:hypothetical protein
MDALAAELLELNELSSLRCRGVSLATLMREEGGSG